MAKQGLTLEQKQTQRLALEQQRLLGMVLEKNDAEMAPSMTTVKTTTGATNNPQRPR